MNESSLNFLLQLPARKRERLLRLLMELADSIHEAGMGMERDARGRDIHVRGIGEWEVSYWPDWENEVRIVRIQAS